jgi:hypothetical protein
VLHIVIGSGNSPATIENPVCHQIAQVESPFHMETYCQIYNYILILVLENNDMFYFFGNTYAVCLDPMTLAHYWP